MSSSLSSSHATVTYTFISSDTDLPSWGILLLEAYESKPDAPFSPVHAPEDPKYLAPSNDDITPTEDQPLPASPIALLPGYIVDSEPIEDDFEEDPADRGGGALAPTDSALPVPDMFPHLRRRNLLIPISLLLHHHHYILLFHYLRLVFIVEYASTPTPPLPPPSSLTPLSSTLLLIPSPPFTLPSPDRKDAIPEADMPPRKRTCFTAPSHRYDNEESYTRYQDAHDDQALLQAHISTLTKERQYFCFLTVSYEREARYACQTWDNS
ncbi:hypothetical protein Tco_0819293 [Tanacetum coccineum]|uniref:Uncharacterized protein n=1 Tax=Tanacetum coccineum TaxID=301880 RepID=A0ABQ5AAH3_9ASTR